MLESLVEAVRASGPALLAAVGGTLFVWSFSLVTTTVHLGHLPGRARNVAYWFVGFWHVLAATTLVLVFGLQNVVLAFLGSAVVTQLLGLYVADGDMETCYRTFDGHESRAEEAKPVSHRSTGARNVIHIDAA